MSAAIDQNLKSFVDRLHKQMGADNPDRAAIADRAWVAVIKDAELKRARSKLSIHELRLIVGHVLDAVQP